MNLTIEKLVYGGKGLARSIPDGKVYFVGGVIPQEKILAGGVTVSGKKYTEVELAAVLEPSPHRIEPLCHIHIKPVGDNSKSVSNKRLYCGGCDFQHIDYTHQLQLKKDIVVETLNRLGGIRDASHLVSEVIPSEKKFLYRNKAIIPFAPIGGEKNGIKAGFYAERSHEIVEAGDCPLQPRDVFKVVNFVKNNAADFGIVPYSEEKHNGSLRHLCVRTNSEGEMLIIFVVKPDASYLARYKKFSDEIVRFFNSEKMSIISILINENPSSTNVIFGADVWHTLWGDEYITEFYPTSGLKLRVSRGGFLQVNTGVADRLYHYVANLIFRDKNFSSDGKSGDFKVLDLYGGVGGFAIMVSKLNDGRIKEIISVEENETAVKDALVNSRLNGVDDITFFALPVERFLENNIHRFKKNVAIIVDPPRSGLSPKAMKAILQIKPERLIYVSCDTATFARDAKILLSNNYRFSSAPDGKIQPFDMFPQTHHVETVADFVRNF